jgi:hypothetical protein
LLGLLEAPAKRVTLELDGVSFWEALDRLCEAAGLSCSQTYTQRGPALRLAEDAPVRPGSVYHVGRLRVQANALNYHRALPLQQRGSTFSEQLVLELAIMGEPGTGIVATFSPRLSEAWDATGRWPVDSQRGFDGSRHSGWSGFHIMVPSLYLPVPSKRGGQLTGLKGVVPVEVVVRRRNLVTVGQLSDAKGKTYWGADGTSLTIEDVSHQLYDNGAGHVQVVVSGPDGWTYDSNRVGFELVDARGRRCSSSYNYLGQQPRRQLRPDDLAWFSAAPAAGFPAPVPWSAVARAGRLTWQWTGTLSFQWSGQREAPVKLVLFSFERLRTEVPFAFHDLPLP